MSTQKKHLELNPRFCGRVELLDLCDQRRPPVGLPIDQTESGEYLQDMKMLRVSQDPHPEPLYRTPRGVWDVNSQPSKDMNIQGEHPSERKLVRCMYAYLFGGRLVCIVLNKETWYCLFTTCRHQWHNVIRLR
jgi:hypothetical protein